MKNKHDFQIGDIVQRIYDYWDDMKPGDQAEIIGFRLNTKTLIFKPNGIGHDPAKFKLIRSKQTVNNSYNLY